MNLSLNIWIALTLIVAFWLWVGRKPNKFDHMVECSQHFEALRRSIVNCKVEEIGSYEDMIEEFVNEWSGKDTAGLAKDYELELRIILESVGEVVCQ